MSHLPAERLAALADHSHCPELAASPAESVHLAACAACAREVDAYRRLATTAAAERARAVEPLLDWSSLAGALRSEGLVADARPDAVFAVPHGVAALIPTGRRRTWRAPWLGRVAAGLLIGAVGVAAGRASARVPAPAGASTGVAAAAAQPSSDTVAGAVHTAGVALGGAAATAASYVADTATRFGNTTEALAALASAERQYERAASFLVQHDSSAHTADSSELYRTRLAALDNVMAATREALYDAPHDPLINRYYFATMGARDATLRQLNTALPQGERISRY